MQNGGLVVNAGTGDDQWRQFSGKQTRKRREVLQVRDQLQSRAVFDGDKGDIDPISLMAGPLMMAYTETVIGGRLLTTMPTRRASSNKFLQNYP